MKRVLMSIFALLVLVSASYGGTIYKWVDKDGVVNFTNDENQIPSEYHNQIQKLEFGGSHEMETPALPPVSAEKSEQAKVDIYGKGEDYWRAKVQPWKKQLQEATENIEIIARQINEKAKEEAGKNLSRTQVEMDLAYRNELLEEISKYKAQVRKANEMLNKITQDAKEAKARP
jgi:hypothetical protein